MMQDTTKHLPVLCDEVLALLLPAQDDKSRTALFLDCTVGGGGHSDLFLERFRELVLLGLDCDQNALKRAEQRLKRHAGRFVLQHGSFAELTALIEKSRDKMLRLLSDRPPSSFPLFDRILADLGYSSDQLEDESRGFSFLKDGPLDMRMNQSQELTAEHVLNRYSPPELRRIFVRGGVGPFSSALVRETIKARPIKSTAEFRRVCESSIPRFSRKSARLAYHPAALPFQAVRMEVNQELENLEEFLEQALRLLVPGGRLGAICFHSLEDKTVTRVMRRWSKEEALRDLPVAAAPARGRLLTKKAILPGENECRKNPRARSARLRVFEKSGGGL